jgi:hypothetical protein
MDYKTPFIFLRTKIVANSYKLNIKIFHLKHLPLICLLMRGFIPTALPVKKVGLSYWLFSGKND